MPEMTEMEFVVRENRKNTITDHPAGGVETTLERVEGLLRKAKESGKGVNLSVHSAREWKREDGAPQESS